ncbi:MAG TPA: YhdH/YhfP family quinone oxidoreductase [Pirellulaceae bacterium]|nr:YhdH/YhfP family quinone oxidoreductase [Pirellulaceae bacterium]HMO92779.1 YhdH/YhfP family quinone oxidoreductase [Pirellulaceae bacterium]HMP69361.1 YhdH/YhfP family quinone oxidoreductase [Pirellulaceae bacterium]
MKEFQITNPYRGVQVSKSAISGTASIKLEKLENEPLQDGEVRIKVNYSSINYKDALAANGNPGVMLTSPLVPGIDAVGVIVESTVPTHAVGCKVILGHEDFGTRRDGGWQEYVRASANWLVNLPSSLSPFRCMAMGTAGFTAAQSLESLLFHETKPERGPIAVSGATGGVGSFSIMLLHHLGYEVIAISSKPDQVEKLKALGAAQVLLRQEFEDTSGRPLLSGRFAGAIDAVGGNTLATIIKSTKRGGVITACGNAGGADLHTNVYPFILRGVSLVGIDSAGVDVTNRQRIWNRLATEWNLPQVESLVTTIDLQQTPTAAQELLAGRMSGRYVVKVCGHEVD